MAGPTRSEIIRAFIPESPFVGVAGLRLESLEADAAVLVLPLRPEVATIGEVVHGGAISTLIDTAAMVGRRVRGLVATRSAATSRGVWTSARPDMTFSTHPCVGTLQHWGVTTSA